MYDTSKGLIARGHDARVYTINTNLPGEGPFFERQIPLVPAERLAERAFRHITGYNDVLFPSTLILRVHPWAGRADLWHFHNLHGHFVSMALLGAMSWTKQIVISPVDQYLLTGHCPYPIDCERYNEGCGSCPRLNEGWPGISRDSTRGLWLMKRFVMRTSRFNMFFHTKALAEAYRKSLPWMKNPRVIPYGVDICCYRPLSRKDCAQALGVTMGKSFVIGIFHSYVNEPRKGLLPLIEQVGRLAEEMPDRLSLLVVGHGSEEVRRLVPSCLNLATLPFLQDPHELAQALNLCDVLLYPTRAENLSLTCLFALSCGVPVISYDVGGQGEAVRDGVNGFLVPMGDHMAMLARLRELCNVPGLQKELALRARTTMEEDYDGERYVERLVDYYKSLF